MGAVDRDRKIDCLLLKILGDDNADLVAQVSHLVVSRAHFDAASLASPGLRRLTAGYLLGTLSNCMFGETIFLVMRGHVEMGSFSISAASTGAKPLPSTSR